MDKVSIHTFSPSVYIKQIVLLSSYLGSWWHKLLRFIISKAMADEEKMRAKLK